MSAQGGGPVSRRQKAEGSTSLPVPALCLLPTASCRLSLRGQSLVEWAVLVVVVVGVLVVGMRAYLQRGYQGYLRSNASAHGVQFDPTKVFVEEHQLNSISHVQEVDILSGQAAVNLFAGDPRLPSVPGGALPGRTLETKVHSEAAWDVRKRATYDAYDY